MARPRRLPVLRHLVTHPIPNPNPNPNPIPIPNPNPNPNPNPRRSPSPSLSPSPSPSPNPNPRTTTIPDRIAVRTADGLSGYASPTCSAITFTIEQANPNPNPNPNLNPNPNPNPNPNQGMQENWQTVDTCAGVDVPVLTGNFGTLAPPRLLTFVADDPDDLDDIYR